MGVLGCQDPVELISQVFLEVKGRRVLVFAIFLIQVLAFNFVVLLQKVFVHIFGDVHLHSEVSRSNCIHVLLCLVDLACFLEEVNGQHEAEGHKHDGGCDLCYLVVFLYLNFCALLARILNKELSSQVIAFFVTVSHAFGNFNFAQKFGILQIYCTRPSSYATLLEMLSNLVFVEILAALLVVVEFVVSHTGV